jgi:glycosyltransferase involved in cell wall biosynthesis
MNTKPNNPEWQAFLKECQTDKRIQLITETLDRPEVLGLINACDAYVSLHRAEGFGRTLAEAMLLGKPVVATNYSGNADFMINGSFPVDFQLIAVAKDTYQWVDEHDQCVWADAQIKHASIQIGSAKSKLTKEYAQKIRHAAVEIFDSKVVAKQIDVALAA